MNRISKTVGKLFLKLEFRSGSGSGKKAIILFLSYFVLGLLLSYFIFRQGIDSTGFQFAFLTYLIFSIVVVFALVTELDNLVISRTEIEVLESLPVDFSVIAGGKLYVLRRLVFFVSLPLLLPGSFFFELEVGSLPHTVLYAAGGILLTGFLMSLVILLYAITLRNISPERVSSFTLILQSLLIIALILGYQFVSYSFSSSSGADAASLYNFLELTGAIRFFPQTWFAAISARQNIQLSGMLILKQVLPLVISYLSYLTLKLYMMDNYGAIYVKFQDREHKEPRDTDKGASSAALRFYSNRNASEAAAFSLMKSMLRRDKTVKQNMVLMFIIPAALAFFALMSGQMFSPFTQFFIAGRPVFHISILIVVLIALNGASTGIKVSNDPQAGWIYDAYPIGSRKRFANGVRKFFQIYFLLPMFIFLLLIFSMRMPLYDALLHSLFIAAAANLLNTFYHLFSRTLPFTKMNTVLNSVQRVGALGLPLVVGVIFVVIQYYAYQRKWYVILGVVVMGLVNYGITLPLRHKDTKETTPLVPLC